jgi:hypothetical protein
MRRYAAKREPRLAEPTRLLRLESRKGAAMDQKPYPAEKARGGEIVLTTPLRRIIFLAGLIGAVVLVFILMLTAH